MRASLFHSFTTRGPVNVDLQLKYEELLGLDKSAVEQTIQSSRGQTCGPHDEGTAPLLPAEERRAFT
ncbi:unnamed protein product [Arctogadus glacialis]